MKFIKIEKLILLIIKVCDNEAGNFFMFYVRQ